jgi:hypothetical protein
VAAQAGKIRVRAVTAANQERGGPVEYYQLRPNDFGRAPVVDGTPGTLLSEALRFYNYGAGQSGYIVEKTDWLRIDADTLPAAIDQLVDGLTDAIVGMAERLARPDRSGHLAYLPKYVLADWLTPDIDATIERMRAAYPAIYPRGAAAAAPPSLGGRIMATRLSVSANVGLLAGHLLFSPELRDPERVRSLHKKAETEGIYFREFERLPGLLPTLRDLVQWNRLAARLVCEPRCAYASTGGARVDLNQSLFDPDLGGSWVIKPDVLGLGSVIPHAPASVGATEKLYCSVASSFFGTAHASAASGGQSGRYGATLLREISEAVDALRLLLPPGDSVEKATSTWTQFQCNIETLECLFDGALELRAERPYDVWDDAGVRVGLPAAFVLTGTLRVYLADLLGRALMLALRQAIWRLYRDVNGYLGVLLWETLSGEDVVGVKHGGCRSLLSAGIHGKRLPVDRFPWEQALIERPWGLADSTHVAAFGKLMAISKRPLAKSPNESRNAPAVTFAAFKRQIVPRSPPTTAQFGAAAGVTTARAPNSLANCDLLFGLRFAAQLQVCVAFRLLAKAQATLAWEKAKYSTPEPTDPAKEGIVKRRAGANLLITAGSYLWGGHKPPHGSSHRDGASVDLVFGPNILPWHRSKLSDALTKEDVAAFPELANTTDLLVAVYTRDDADWAVANHAALEPGEMFITALEAMPLNDVVFLQLLRSNVVNPVIERLATLARDNPMGFKWDDEQAAYREAEEKLAGTSHFIDTNEARTAGVPPTEITELGDWQRTHSAHVAILASDPESMIFASTITHVRAMRAIRATFCASGIELFRIARTETLVKYLDNPAGGTLPEALAAAFSAAGIPIVGAPRISCEVLGRSWRMTMQDAEFTLAAPTDTELLVSFVPAEGARKAAGELVAGARFDPKPHDHHHHWHVRYYSDPRVALARLESMRELWLALAIDLEPFCRYLDQSFPAQAFGDELLREAAEECAAVRRFCLEYDTAFKERYGAANLDHAGAQGAGTPSPAQRLHHALARCLSESLFGHFVEGSELIAPAIRYADFRAGSAGKVSAELSAAIIKSRHIIERLTQRWRAERDSMKRLKERGPFPDYLEEFIQGLRDLSLPPATDELKKSIYFHEPPKLSPESDAPP